jgi:hypothetical protein
MIPRPTSPFIASRPLSSKPEAVRQRNLRLTDDEYANRSMEYSRQAKRREAYKAQIHSLESRKSELSKMGKLKTRILHHLSKGRDVGSIAIRESLLVSTVQQVVDQIREDQNNGNHPDPQPHGPSHP